MAKIKSNGTIHEFHARAVDAARAGKSMKEFAKEEGTLANNVQARLYEAVLAGEAMVVFQEPVRSTRRRSEVQENVSRITLYTGRAKTPYLTLKVPTDVVQKAGGEGDYIEWKFSRGQIVGKKIDAPAPGAVAADSDMDDQA